MLPAPCFLCLRHLHSSCEAGIFASSLTAGEFNTRRTIPGSRLVSLGKWEQGQEEYSLGNNHLSFRAVLGSSSIFYVYVFFYVYVYDGVLLGPNLSTDWLRDKASENNEETSCLLKGQVHVGRCLSRPWFSTQDFTDVIKKTKKPPKKPKTKKKNNKTKN